MRRWLPATLIAGAWIFSLVAYSRLPEQVPVHWGFSGEPNRYGSRLEGAFLLPLIMTAIYVVMQWYPSRDPRAGNIAKFRGSYDSIVTAMLAFLGGMHVLSLAGSLGWHVDMPTVVLVGLGMLFIVFGNLLPRARSNFILGIRTPWTLSSESVWARVHRVGGYAMVVAGFVAIASAFIARPIGIIVAVAFALLSGLVPAVYSYVLWSREHGHPSSDTP